MEDERESARGGESCECLKWNVIRASERRAASEQKALAPHLLGRPIPDRCGAIGIEHAALTKPSIASNWRWQHGQNEQRK